jgi:potassium channel subfamily K protein 16
VGEHPGWWGPLLNLGGSCALRHLLSTSLTGTDPSKHYISVYRSLAAIWILLGLAWLALILSLGPLLLHRSSQLQLSCRGLSLKDREAPDSKGLPRPQKIPISA